MPLVTVFLVIAVVGVVLWLINNKADFIDPTMKKIINVVAVIAVVIWLLKVFGLLDSLNTITV